ERVIRRCESRGEGIALSAISLLEIAILMSVGRERIKASLPELFAEIDANAMFKVLPIDTAVAAEAAALLSLRDPGDRAIVATARVYRLTLLTSDQRIIDSGLVSTVE